MVTKLASVRIAEIAEMVTDFLLQEAKKNPSWRHERVLHNDFARTEGFEGFEEYMRKRIRYDANTLIFAMVGYLDEQTGISYDYSNGEGLKW